MILRPQLLFARFVGPVTSCCRAAIVVEIDQATPGHAIFCGGCLQDAPFVHFPAMRMGLTASWPWLQVKVPEIPRRAAR